MDNINIIHHTILIPYLPKHQFTASQIKSMPSTTDDKTRCLQMAIRLLSRRDHSRKELANKLSSKDCADTIDLSTLLDQLENADYLNDERYAEMYVRSRITRGQGPKKIQYELIQRGVTQSLIDSAMQCNKADWLSLAQQQREKRFGKSLPDDYKQQAKQSRFLAGRGFSSETIRSIFYR